jgi:RNA:NAD 2'-phosphotransferase (TPT1/KptA family)
MPGQKHQRSLSSDEYAERMYGNRKVSKTIVAAIESRCFMRDPETKQKSATWLSRRKPKAQKVGMKKSRIKEC